MLIFGGKQVIVPDSLEDSTGISQYKADDTTLHEQERDTYKYWKNQSINLVILGVENQSKPDRDMPFRVIGYDGAPYRSQLLKTKEKRVKGVLKQVPAKERSPVVTIVLYFGEKPWRYPLELKSGFKPKLPDNEIAQALEPYINDYKVNLFDIPRLPPETVSRFRSDFRIVAEYFTNAYVNPDYEPAPAVITHVDELLKLMQVLTGDNRYATISFTEKEKKEGVGMCKVLDAREKRGAKHVITLMHILANKGYSMEEILAMTSEEKDREKLYREYGIA